MFSNLKISTKLIISSAVFLVPIGVMLFFITSYSLETIQRTRQEQDGIRTLKPLVTVMQALPEYLDVFLGFQQGNLRQLDEEITNALRFVDRELRQYERAGEPLPNLTAEWETLKRINRDNEEIFYRYVDFAASLTNLISLIGERSGLILVTDINTYYFVASALSAIPEASLRSISIGNLLRRQLHEADAVIQRWNNELADAQALGRRLAARPFTGDSRDLTFTMLPSEYAQLVRNARPLFDADRDRIRRSLISAIDGGGEGNDFDDLAARLGDYEEAHRLLGTLLERTARFGEATAPLKDILNATSQLNTSLCRLWSESFNHLVLLVQQSAARAQRQLVLYLSVVSISIALAIGFVIFITSNINRSVKSLKTLFKGLNENDLTISLPILSRDEFGELMIAFNAFLDILRSTFGSFKQSSQLVADSVFDISSSSKEITTTANQQSASVSEIVSTMESSKNLSEQIAIKTTEVANLAAETQGLSNKGMDLNQENLSLMEDILKQNQKTINEMRNLSDMIIRISEAIRIIDSIADQTKLIAFNASLEASSSGEAGARFSVVASEIRRFADNVAESTHEIKQRIEEVQEASQTLISEANSGSRQIGLGYERMCVAKEEFAQIVDNSQNVATRSQQISNLSKQQELASSQIFTALQEISAGVKQFVVATSSTSKIADSLNNMSEELKGNVAKYRTES